MVEDPENRRAALARLLIQRSVQTGSFTLASGQTSSYYIDARRTTMSAQGLELIGQLGLRTIREAGWTAQFVGGMTLGADPVAYAIALSSRHAPPELNAFTVRREPKAHGTRSELEGCFEPGARVVVVEDVVTTGSSARKAAQAVARAGGQVLGVLSVVDREEGGRVALESAGFRLRTLVTLRDLGIEPISPDRQQ